MFGDMIFCNLQLCIKLLLDLPLCVLEWVLAETLQSWEAKGLVQLSCAQAELTCENRCVTLSHAPVGQTPNPDCLGGCGM